MSTDETTSITASVTSNGYSGPVDLTARAFNFDVTITPTQASLAPGGRAEFTATLKLKEGSGTGSYTVPFTARGANDSSGASLSITVTRSGGSTSNAPEGTNRNLQEPLDCAKAGVGAPSVTPAAAIISCDWQPPSATSAGGYYSFELNVTSVTTEYTITQTYPSQLVPNHIHVQGRHSDGFSFQDGVFTLRAKAALIPEYGVSGPLVPRLLVGILSYKPGEHQEFAGVTISTNSSISVGTDWGVSDGGFLVTVKVEGVSGTRGFYEGFFPVSFLRSGGYSSANTTVKFDGQPVEATRTESARGLTLLLADYPHSPHRIDQEFRGGEGGGSGTPGFGSLAAIVSLGCALLVWTRRDRP